MKIADRLHLILEDIPENVQLVAVSKTKPVASIIEAYEAGQRDFGENKIQEMAEKAATLPKDIRWHMIGHVQTNKIKYMAGFVHLVHGVDRPKVLFELQKEASKINKNIQVLFQVHIAEEETKFGLDEPELFDLIREVAAGKFPDITVRGLMGMATFTDHTDQIRREFVHLKNLFDQSKMMLNDPGFDTLSMGMSGDFKIAIEEGSNMVRIGTSIFGER